MKRVIGVFSAVWLAGCSIMPENSNDWVVVRDKDQFYGTSSCIVMFNDVFRNLSAMYGIRYYPFFTKAGDGETYFGVGNNRNVPVGDVLIKIDHHQPIRISASETPISEHSYQHEYPEAYREEAERAAQSIMAMQSPYTLAETQKSQEILAQAKSGNNIMVRIIGYGVNNSIASTDGEYPLTENMRAGLRQCGI